MHALIRICTHQCGYVQYMYAQLIWINNNNLKERLCLRFSCFSASNVGGLSCRRAHVACYLQQAGPIDNGTGNRSTLQSKLRSSGVPSLGVLRRTPLRWGGEGNGSLEGHEMLQVGLKDAGVDGISKAWPLLAWLAMDQVVGKEEVIVFKGS